MTLSAEVLEKLAAIVDVPDGVREVAVRHFTDAIGVGLAAATSEAGSHWRIYAEARGESGPASVFGSDRAMSAPTAALINGGLIHSLEYDDTHTGSIVHGSAVLAAAALAAGEAAGASGTSVMRAYTLWYEVFIRMGLAAAGGFQNRGYQLTSVGGALCAAGIAASLKNLDFARTQAAIGIALSQASGVFEFLTNGSTVKSLHPGWAAHAGLIAADLAEAGMTGPLTAIEGRFGLFRLFAGDDEAPEKFHLSLQDLGLSWHLERAAYKFHPCCHYLHPFIEAARLLRGQGATAEAIDWIECRVPQGAAGIICEPWPLKQTSSGHAARWSLPVTVAMQFVDGRVDLASFEEPLSDGVAELAKKASWRPLEDCAFPDRFEALVRVGLKDGPVLEQYVEDVFGNATRPPAEEDIAAKFHGNVTRLALTEAADALARALAGLWSAANLEFVSAALRALPQSRN